MPEKTVEELCQKYELTEEERKHFIEILVILEKAIKGVKNEG